MAWFLSKKARQTYDPPRGGFVVQGPEKGLKNSTSLAAPHSLELAPLGFVQVKEKILNDTQSILL